MRPASLIALAAVVALCGSAAAADSVPSPRNLVLRQSDVPNGFRLDKDHSGVQPTREIEDRDARRLFARAGRVTGYEAEFDRARSSISSRADLFRTPAGARIMLSYVEREIRKAGISRMRAARVQIGTEGWVWGSRGPVAFTIVVWRYGRVFAGVAGDIPRARTLALARVQQRRIAAALR